VTGSSATGTSISCGAPAGCSAPYPPVSLNSATTLSATPAAGSVFGGWSGGGCGGTGNCVVSSVLANTTITATFNTAVPPVTVTVAKAGTGTGNVTSAPAGIDCGVVACSAPFPSGSPVTLAAGASPGSVFVGWSGPCTGTGNCIFAPSANTTVTATFNLVTFPLTVQTTGSGAGTVSSAPGGISCPGDCSESYAAGLQVALTAMPEPGL
jgi:hypothetical protein